MDTTFTRLFEKITDLTKRKKIILLNLTIVFSICIIAAAAFFIPEQIDWMRTFRPAALKIIHGQSPYSILSFSYPVWMLFPLIPIAILPVKIGNGILFFVQVLVLIFIAIKMGASPFSLAAFFLSFPILFMLLFGQIDWLVLTGLIFPPWAGLFFLLAKPQLGLIPALFLIIEEWRKNGFKKTLLTVTPVCVAFMISFLVYGAWFLQLDYGFLTAKYNFSLWPSSISFGLFFIIYSIRKRKIEAALLANPLLSPYVGPHSWSGAMLAVLPYKLECILVSLSTWIIMYIKAQG